MKQKANGRSVIVSFSGLNENTVEEGVRRSKTSEIHFLAIAFSESAMQYRNEKIVGMSSDEGAELKYRAVDPERVRAMPKLAEEVNGF